LDFLRVVRHLLKASCKSLKTIDGKKAEKKECKIRRRPKHFFVSHLQGFTRRALKKSRM
jgi:hypothetical protein